MRCQWLALGLVAVLTGCGGGGGDDDETPVTLSPMCSQAVDEFRHLLRREPAVYQASGPTNLALGSVRDAVICAPSAYDITVARADGLVALVSESSGNIEVRAGQAELLLATAASRGDVTYLGDALDADLAALSAGDVTVGSVFNRPDVDTPSEGRVIILRR